MTRSCYILLGSNINPNHNIRRAIDLLNDYFEVASISKIYESKPIVKNNVENYLNAVVEVKSDLRPQKIKYDKLRKIEDEMGRVRTNDKFKPRCIDLDLIMLENEIYDDGDIVLPDPEIEEYGHVAIPLADVAGERIHPTAGRTIAEIADEFRSASELEVIQE